VLKNFAVFGFILAPPPLMACDLAYLCDFTPFGRSIVSPSPLPLSPSARGGGGECYELAPRIVEQEIVEQELYISGSKVIWSAAGRLLKTFNLPSSARQACWCAFASEIEPCLCVHHNDGLLVYTKGGHVYPVVLPCKICRVWPLPSGLLLERDQGVAGLDEVEQQQQQRVEEHDDEQVPSFFVLLHPLEDVSPVAIRCHAPPSSSSSSSPTRAFPSAAPSSPRGLSQQLQLRLPRHRVLYSSASCPFLVLYDFERGCHSFWTLEELHPRPQDLPPLVPTPAQLAAYLEQQQQQQQQHGEEEGADMMVVEGEQTGLLFPPRMAICCVHTQPSMEPAVEVEQEQGRQWRGPAASVFECGSSGQQPARPVLCLLHRDPLGRAVAVEGLAAVERPPGTGLQGLSLVPAFVHRAAAAVGVRIRSSASAGFGPSLVATHLLVLHPDDGSLRLYAGEHLLAICSLRLPPGRRCELPPPPALFFIHLLSLPPSVLFSCSLQLRTARPMI